ncbi:MAG: metallophosphoesterase [Clostridia bacterium]|nr:metallophosphoesterase [Clostridia bacterium]
MASERRFLFASDFHYDCKEKLFDGKGYQYDYGEDADDRMESLLSLITEEHEKYPFDGVFFLGDNAHERYENVVAFMGKYVSRIPCPVHLLPGNHEGHSNELWKAAVGTDRQHTVDMDGLHFWMVDSFWEVTHPHRLQEPDWDYLTREAERCKNGQVVLCCHYLRWDCEPLEKWISEQKNLIAVIHGHSHNSYPRLEQFGGKKVISSGNYSYGLDMRDEPSWDEKWGWSVTELTEKAGQWQCRKIYPEYYYPLAQLTYPNRFANRVAEDQDVKKHYGAWESLI